MSPDPKTVREIATEHIRSGRIDIGTTVELMLIGVILDREELAAWENAVQQAIRAAVPSWPDEQQPADVVTAEQQPWPRAQRMPLAVVGQHVQPWHHQAIAEYGAAIGTELEPNPTIPGGYTAAQVNRAITWWNERVTAEQQQDGAATEAAGRVAAFCDALDHYGDDGNPIASEHNPDGDPDTVLYLSLTKQDLRAVLAERTALATRVAELESERDGDLCILAAFLLPNRRPIEHWLAILANHFEARTNALMRDADRFAAARFRVDRVPAATETEES